MAIQSRRGNYADFDPAKLLPGEWAVVQGGDTSAADGKAVYMAFSSGDVKRMATYEDIVENISEATEEVAQDVAEQIEENLQSMVQDAQTAAQTATTKANEASQSASSVSASAAQIATNASDISDLKEAMDDAEADIENVLQTKAPVIINTATGQIATFADGADGMNVKSLKVNMEPIQDLHGYDHPWPAGGGKNKLEVTATSRTVSGITFTVNEDGSIKVNGTASELCTFNVASLDTSISGMILNGCPEGGNYGSLYALYIAVNDRTVVSDIGNGATIPSLSGNTVSANILVRAGVTVSNLLFKPMIRLASESDATFTPYSNICPISGLDEVEVKRTGKNLLNPNTLIAGDYNGTNRTLRVSQALADRIVVREGEKYGLSIKSYDKTQYPCNRLWIAITDKNNVLQRIMAANSANNVSVVIPQEFDGMRLTIIFGGLAIDSSWAPITVSDVISMNPMLERYTDSPTYEYEPYDGQVITESFPATVYGGTLDLETGELVVDMRIVDLGSLNWTYDANNTQFYSNVIDDVITASHWQTPIVSSCYKVLTSDASVEPSIHIRGFAAKRLYVVDTRYTDGTNYKSAISGQTIVYPLATPITYTLTPKQLETVKGINHISANGNTSIDVDYCADTKLYIDQKLATAIANALNA